MNQLTPPYPWIRAELSAGRVIPFLGAGASFGERNPSESAWRTRTDGGGRISFLPTASELADLFASNAGFPAGESRELPKVTQYFGTFIGRKGLQRQLQEIFTFAQPPGAIHTYLAELAGRSPLLIVTTNYDDLIERALEAAGRPFDTVVHLTEPGLGGDVLWRPNGATEQKAVLAKDVDIDMSSVSVVYKMHGSIDRSPAGRSQYVITEDDYVEFLTRMTKSAAIPNIFAEPFQTRPFLFLGYGLYDWNLRVVLNRIEKELRRPGDITSWAIEPRPKPLEKALWEKRNVAVFDGLTLNEFVERLRAVATGSAES
jgi:hypothetical protein